MQVDEDGNFRNIDANGDEIRTWQVDLWPPPTTIRIKAPANMVLALPVIAAKLAEKYPRCAFVDIQMARLL